MFAVLLVHILFWGPGVNEGGFQALADKGVKPAFEAAWEERQPYDSGSLKNVLGNFGND
jgi:hypothetical protein